MIQKCYDTLNRSVVYDSNKTEIGSVTILKQQQQILKQQIENYTITPQERILIDNEIGTVKIKSLKK